MKNMIPEIVERLHLLYGEEFKVKNTGNDHESSGHFFFTEDALYRKTGDGTSKRSYRTLTQLIYGDKTVVRFPYRPSKGQEYWTLFIDYNTLYGNPEVSVYARQWEDSPLDRKRLEQKVVYRTSLEAIADKDNGYRRMTGN